MQQGPEPSKPEGTIPASDEARFSLDETFFSRTDPRGVIQAYNDVFLRISGYSAAQLRKAPHRIIRHPDMPKGVFQLMWDGLLAGYPVAAYVKNRAQDGRHYWVFALVSPVEDGFLSVRMKPTGPLFATVAAEYAALAEAERSERLTPRQSAERLLARLKGLGFPRYAAFQTQALATEMQARDAGLGHEADRKLAAMARLSAHADRIHDHKAKVTADLLRLQLVPVNMRIIAARIERAGGPLGAISDNYRELSGMVMRELEHLLQDGAGGSTFRPTTEEEALFLHASARLMQAAVAQFDGQQDAIEGIATDAERARLTALSHAYDAQAGAALGRLSQASGRLVTDMGSLRRAIVALDSIRIMSRVECGRMVRPHDGLASLVGALDGFHAGLDAHLDAIASAAQSVCDEAGWVVAA